MLKTQNQPTVVKFFLLSNFIVGIAVGAYFSWELSIDCGTIFIGASIAGFLFGIMNVFLLITKSQLTRNLIILLCILAIGVLILPLVTFKSVSDSSLCGWQFCLGQGVNNQQSFISQFQSQTTEADSNFCSNISANAIAYALTVFYFGQYRQNISTNEIWSIKEGLPMAALAILALFALLEVGLFSVFIWKHRKDRGERLLID